MTQSTMKVAHFKEYGPPSVLISAEADRPVPGAGEVLVRVRVVSEG